MSTPVLTKEQQRKTLSAKKAPVKGLRNVLALPYERFWPVLKHDEGGTMEKILQKSLPLVKHSSIKIPWKELRKMSKEERLEARKHNIHDKDVPNENKIKNIVMGINAVTRSLEKSNLCSVLLDATVDPTLLVQHIVTMCVDKNIPVLLLPFLKRVTLENIGFQTASIGFKNTVAESSTNTFFEVDKTIHNIYKRFMQPKATSQLFKINDSIKPSEDVTMTLKTEKKVIYTVSTNVYKYRNSIKERAFVPPTSDKSQLIFMDNSNDYIPMSTDHEFSDNENENVNCKKRYTEYFNDPEKNGSDKESYVSLKVKRLQGSGNRVKATKLKKKKT